MGGNSKSPAPGRPPIAILGVPFDNVTRSEALEQIEQMVSSREPHYVVTPNVDFLVQARSDIELRRILFEAHLVLCDGTPLVWASRLLGNPLPERVAGADIVPLLIEVAEQRNYRLFLLGATPDSCNRAVSRLQKEHPRLVIAGHYSPDFNALLEMDHEAIKRRILEAKPDLLLVSFGCPKQEKWISMHYFNLGVPVTAGVGATIDFLAGQVKRAPMWMRRIGMEWVFRLVQEPRRLFRRYVNDFWVFGRSILLQWWQLKLRGEPRKTHHPVRAYRLPDGTKAKGLSCSTKNDLKLHCFSLPERFDFAAISDNDRRLAEAFDTESHCVLDMSAVSFIDSTGVGFLIRLQKSIRAAGHQLVLLNPHPNVHRALVVMGLENFFVSALNIQSAHEVIAARTGEQSPVVTVRSDSAHSILGWHGEITAANSEPIWERTRAEMLRLADVREWTIDLAAVRFIDSTGLGLLVRLRKLCQKNKQAVHFANLQPAVRNVLRIAQLEEFLLGITSQSGVWRSDPMAELGATTASVEPAATR